MRSLIWHWGRRGAGPIFAARLAEGLNALAGEQAFLSLAAGAELLADPQAPDCAWAEPTYGSKLGYIAQRLANPFLHRRTRRHLQALRPDLAICAMPALLDGRMLSGLRAQGVPYAVIVHDAEAHPGESVTFQAMDQQRLMRGARHLICLSGHVEAALRRQGYGQFGQGLTRLWHPPFDFSTALRPVQATERPKILHFGRLLPYKGLDLLADALAMLGPDLPFELRICGDGPKSPALDRLRAMPGVRVECRWFADAELPGLLAWSDALVLPYREASQSGVAALGLAAGRHVLATNVGGLPEQLGGQPNATLCAPEPAAIATGLLDLTAQLAGSGAVQTPGFTPGWREMAAALVRALAGEPEPVAAQAQLEAAE